MTAAKSKENKACSMSPVRQSRDPSGINGRIGVMAASIRFHLR
ncbi:hypothetical protein SynA1825c_01993 [Synechococcus sp. A18-25c]|nr:hypothetical protein SynA1825c_01993 [Synechococcus sp. A18-25c]